MPDLTKYLQTHSLWFHKDKQDTVLSFVLFFSCFSGKFDVDGDGEITTEELRSAMNKLMGEHMNRREIDAIVKEADDNGDGTVDFEGAIRLSAANQNHFMNEVLTT